MLSRPSGSALKKVSAWISVGEEETTPLSFFARSANPPAAKSLRLERRSALAFDKGATDVSRDSVPFRKSARDPQRGLSINLSGGGKASGSMPDAIARSWASVNCSTSIGP
jgi:hypothetical protein